MTSQVSAYKTCSPCKVAKPITDFWKSGTLKDGRQSACTPCAKASTQRARQKRRENGKARVYSVTVAAPKVWRYNLRRKYGLSVEQYDALLAEQGGVCAICRQPERQTTVKTGTRWKLAVDHDHATGSVRGLLCHCCNRGIGYLRDHPEILRQAAAYLSRGLDRTG